MIEICDGPPVYSIVDVVEIDAGIIEVGGMYPTAELHTDAPRSIDRRHDEPRMVNVGSQHHRRLAGTNDATQHHVAGLVSRHAHVLASCRPVLDPLDHAVLMTGDCGDGSQFT